MDDLELVLRFFALRRPEEMNMNFRDYLSDFMGKRNKAYKSNSQLPPPDAAAFHWAVTNAEKVFGDEAFRRPSRDEAWEFSKTKSAPLADAVMVALSDVSPGLINETAADNIRKQVWSLCVMDDKFYKSITAGTNGKNAIIYRIEAVRNVIKHATT
jgi:hypothetical protein